MHTFVFEKNKQKNHPEELEKIAPLEVLKKEDVTAFV